MMKGVMKIRCALVLVLLLVFGIAAADAAYTPILPEGAEKVPMLGEFTRMDAADFTFALVSDRTGIGEVGVMERAAALINAKDVAFTMNVGDLIEGYTKDAALLRDEYAELDQELGALDAPFFFVAGNHDLSCDEMYEYYVSHRGAPYYAFRYGEALFLMLNTEDPSFGFDEEMEEQLAQLVTLARHDYAQAEVILKGWMAEMGETEGGDAEAAQPESGRFSEAQMAFVEKALADNQDVQWTFVSLHKPAWENDESGWARISEALDGRNYTVFNGHYHYLKKTVRDSMNYIQLGRTGGSFHREGDGDIQHISLVSLQGGIPTITFETLDGKMLTVDEIETIDYSYVH